MKTRKHSATIHSIGTNIEMNGGGLCVRNKQQLGIYTSRVVVVRVRFPGPICCRVRPHLCIILSASSISPRFLNRRFIIGRKEGKSSCAYLLRNLGDEQQV